MAESTDPLSVPTNATEAEAADISELPEKGDKRGKKRTWKKAPLIDYLELQSYVPSGKAQNGTNAHKGGTGGKGAGKGEKGKRNGCKGGKGRVIGRGHDERGHTGEKEEKGDNAPDDDENSGHSLPKRGEGAYVPPRPDTAAGDQGMKGRREGGKRGGKGFDGKTGRYNRAGGAGGRKGGGSKGQSHGSNDIHSTLSNNKPKTFAGMHTGFAGAPASGSSGFAAPTVAGGRMSAKTGGFFPPPTTCSGVPMDATMTASTGVAGFSIAPLPLTTGALPDYVSTTKPPLYAMPYVVMPESVVAYPFVPETTTIGTVAWAPFTAPAIPQHASGAGALHVPGFAPAAKVTADHRDILNKTTKQIEHYFSTDNLLNDFYLRMHMDGEGWVSIALIAHFPSIRSLTADKAVVLEAISSSDTLEIDSGKTCLRLKGQWARWLLNQPQSADGVV